jgi:ligand-binding SRPBCC domain-containing protein
MKPHVLETTTFINRPLEEVFAFFSKAENLNELTPPELHFTIDTPLPIKMFPGTLIDYSIRLSGIPFKWKTRITKWEPPFEFVDEQIKGPYVRWHHTHTFKASNGGTIMTDRVEFLSPGWILEPLINALFIQKKVESIFKYRESQLKRIFPD